MQLLVTQEKEERKNQVIKERKKEREKERQKDRKKEEFVNKKPDMLRNTYFFH